MKNKTKAYARENALKKYKKNRILSVETIEEIFRTAFNMGWDKSKERIERKGLIKDNSRDKFGRSYTYEKGKESIKRLRERN